MCPNNCCKVLSGSSLQSIMNIADLKDSIKKYGESCCKKLKAHLMELKLIFNMLILVIAVSTDPLFLYIPILDEKRKCLEMDKELKIIALVLRSVTDMYYVFHIIFQIQEGFIVNNAPNKETTASDHNNELQRNNPLAIVRRIRWFRILIDVLAVLPIPQVIILVFVSRLWGSFRFLATRKLLYFILLFQYVIRVIHIYRLCEKLRKTTSVLTGIIWIKGGFNLFLYIIASHVLGAFWYFFAVQRETRCWLDACKKYPGCTPSTFECSNDISSRKAKFLEVFCPVNRPNPKVFDFGIFLEAIYSGLLSSTDFSTKFGQCFWWGLRNLSSFGQNLQPSDNAWEIFFASNISIIGLLIFLYLIGNLQVYMQLTTTKWEELREKLKKKEPEIDSWISNHGLPSNIKPKVMKHIRGPLRNDNDLDVNNLLAMLQEYLNRQRGKGAEEKDIEKMCLQLASNISEGKRHQRNMKDATIDCWMSTNEIPKHMKPKIKQCILCKLQDDKDVNLVHVLSVLPGDLKKSLKEELCKSTLEAVPQLNEMGKQVREAIIEHLKPVCYAENVFIIREGEPLDFMLFITQGLAWTFKAPSSHVNAKGTSSINVKSLQKGDVFGEELLTCEMRSTASFENVALSTTNIKSHTKVEAFALMAVDWKHVQKTKSWWIHLHKYTRYDPLEEPLKKLAVDAIGEAWRRYKEKRESKKFNSPSASTSLLRRGDGPNNV